ncbi:HAD family hydrolase [Kosakonia sacchari]|uniref:phosphoglycolate phosphatase n=1 Tax=Kosakonia sacchari TaxID=1158459 RepID=A0A1G4Y3B1_9ENTR|nr:HAD-IA family hydrolase [Kosakonia sacchari]AHJ76774.1 haloacid dehalogenase [Kosakonia sacchari SP1]SCX47863.1 haloacid dehalogenase superfamily, subfamily IA, variant 1 with third motif having Dx(3-4)D or Dx(3-4)E [Kosakonia sacchari]
MKSVLITDLDNTLFDWFTIWHASFSAMLNEVSRISNIPVSELKPQIKQIHQKHGTAEYAFVLEEIPSLIQKYGGREQINKALDSAIHAYRSERKKHLFLYPTVLDTLLELKRLGVLIIGYTESKEYYSNYRVSKLNLDGVIDILFSPEDHSIPAGVQPQTSYNLNKTVNRHTPYGEVKPNPKILREIISSVNAMPEDCVYIGDSEMKDIAMALDAGVDAVFANYGNKHFISGTDYNLLREVTHWTDAEVENERKIKEEKKDVHAEFVIEEFSELLNLFVFTEFNQNV